MKLLSITLMLALSASASANPPNADLAKLFACAKSLVGVSGLYDVLPNLVSMPDPRDPQSILIFTESGIFKQNLRFPKINGKEVEIPDPKFPGKTKLNVLRLNEEERRKMGTSFGVSRTFELKVRGRAPLMAQVNYRNLHFNPDEPEPGFTRSALISPLPQPLPGAKNEDPLPLLTPVDELSDETKGILTKAIKKDLPNVYSDYLTWVELREKASENFRRSNTDRKKEHIEMLHKCEGISELAATVQEELRRFPSDQSPTVITAPGTSQTGTNSVVAPAKTKP